MSELCVEHVDPGKGIPVDQIVSENTYSKEVKSWVEVELDNNDYSLQFSGK